MRRRARSQAGPPPLHELDRDVMEEVWRLGEASVRDVLDALNARSERQRAYTTVLSTLQRLTSKGMVKPRSSGRSHVYAAVLERERYARARAGAEVDALVDEFGDAALVQFARRMAGLDPRRREQLRRLAGRDEQP
jgi:predicted transcriptional regulator